MHEQMKKRILSLDCEGMNDFNNVTNKWILQNACEKRREENAYNDSPDISYHSFIVGSGSALEPLTINLMSSKKYSHCLLHFR